MGGAIQLVTAEATEPPHGSATDDDLVSLATQGNRAAFEALLRRHYDLMHRVAWRMTGSQTDAQDICQDVCCALVERIASFRGEAKFTTWLVGIVRNACHDHHRRHSTLTRLKGHLAVLAEMAAPPDGRDLFRRSWLATELARLSPLLRETVVLVVGEGMTHAEAATALGVSESTISGRMHEVRRQAGLAKDIGDEY
ncbi:MULTISPECIES: RNA polymerase sigma factor [Bradyrhizobium]|uniref:RNA polymerase sigma factor n=1 Tax=Bradyrhizobium TaxID=374 RepID=UPI000231CB31|nr:sigma-70 family RNA polymerase sigma factor [Bradyrhizobium japonicum]KMJ98338.1 RNA polymerase subunit sigma-24 [Bradyrhizobium japonicum]MCS3540958.1 RNA polymerase sigma-70 factor (ECF subfamily) [Bradyrhizobium japonicum]MCS3991859.1 RNA polymerase sigma-70 factor (ECF subfamily) [Bradyrhizobium japonicum]MCS4013331.1 RNA polymerase sigma-70 factor (ECF subfamily) [Bradyrhizobium japonicum]MCS4209339.1 RNA polymerase sigma-70 factor (ECF subfamily) [Bradyrhizobium japonicum]